MTAETQNGGAPTSATPFAQVHELSYGPYRGERSSSLFRAWVIALETFRQAWKSKGLKRTMWMSWMVCAGFGFAMYVLVARVPPELAKAKFALPKLDTYILWAVANGLYFTGMIAATVVGGATVSDDLRAGAFQFYFSRPIRTVHYVFGKIVGVGMAVGVVVVIPALALAVVRIGLEPESGETLHAFGVLPRTLLLSGLMTIILASLSVLISSLSRRKIFAQAGFILLLLVGAGIGQGLAQSSRNIQYKLLSVGDLIEAIGYGLFPRYAIIHKETLVFQTALTVAVGIALVSISLLLIRLRRIELSSLGT